MVLVVDFGFDDDSTRSSLGAMETDAAAANGASPSTLSSGGAYMSLFEHLPSPKAAMHRMREGRPSVQRPAADDAASGSGAGGFGMFDHGSGDGGVPRGPLRTAPVTVDELADLFSTRLKFPAARSVIEGDDDGDDARGGGDGGGVHREGRSMVLDDIAPMKSQEPLPATPVPLPQPTLGCDCGFGGVSVAGTASEGAEVGRRGGGIGGGGAAGIQPGEVIGAGFGIGSKRGTRMAMGMSMGPRGTLKTHMEPVLVRGDSQSRSKVLRELDGALWDCDKQRQDIDVIVTIGRGSMTDARREHGGTAILLGPKTVRSTTSSSESGGDHVEMPTSFPPSARRFRELTNEPSDRFGREFDLDDGFDDAYVGRTSQNTIPADDLVSRLLPMPHCHHLPNKHRTSFPQVSCAALARWYRSGPRYARRLTTAGRLWPRHWHRRARPQAAASDYGIRGGGQCAGDACGHRDDGANSPLIRNPAAVAAAVPQPRAAG